MRRMRIALSAALPVVLMAALAGCANPATAPGQPLGEGAGTSAAPGASYLVIGTFGAGPLSASAQSARSAEAYLNGRGLAVVTDTVGRDHRCLRSRSGWDMGTESGRRAADGFLKKALKAAADYRAAHPDESRSLFSLADPPFFYRF